MPFWKKEQKRNSSVVGLTLNSPGVICPSGYSRLIDAPEVAAAVWRIADMISSMTIQLRENAKNGDVRVKDELARKVDIAPWSLGTRQTWLRWIVATMLLEGNSCVLPVTRNGLLEDLVPMPLAKPVKRPDGSDYEIRWEGIAFEPDEVLHFPLRPDLRHPWLGVGTRVQLQDIVASIQQTAATKQAYMSSEYKPPIVISVNADSDLSDEDKRSAFVEKFVKRKNQNEPLIIPADLMTMQQIKPLSLTDLAIKDGIELDKKNVAAIFGVPGFMVGVGSYNKDEYNTFISSVLLPLAQVIEQELTKKLLISTKRYFSFNALSLYAYDLKELSTIGDEQYVRGLMTGNEVRNWLHLPPKEGLDKLVMLENYIPADRIGDQKKLKGENNNAED